MSNRQQTIRVQWDYKDKVSVTRFANGRRNTVSELVIENIDSKNYIGTIITVHTPKILINL